MADLKPCPFCGNEQPKLTWAMGEHWVHCPACLASPGMQPSEEAAIAVWNRRHTPKPELPEGWEWEGGSRDWRAAGRVFGVPVHVYVTDGGDLAASRPAPFAVIRAVLARHDREVSGG